MKQIRQPVYYPRIHPVRTSELSVFQASKYYELVDTLLALLRASRPGSLPEAVSQQQFLATEPLQTSALWPPRLPSRPGSRDVLCSWHAALLALLWLLPQVMVWNWMEYCTTLQHIGLRAAPILGQAGLWNKQTQGLLWNTFVHVVMYAYYGLKAESLLCSSMLAPAPPSQVLKVPTPGAEIQGPVHWSSLHEKCTLIPSLSAWKNGH